MPQQGSSVVRAYLGTVEVDVFFRDQEVTGEFPGSVSSVAALLDQLVNVDLAALAD